MSDTSELVRDASGETLFGLRVAAYRETHPEHGDKYGHRYSEHWSTPNTRDPRVKVERLFTEDQVTSLTLQVERLTGLLREMHRACLGQPVGAHDGFGTRTAGHPSGELLNRVRTALLTPEGDVGL